MFDNSNLIALCVVGDGKAETGPLAASWRSDKFVDPARDGAVLPVQHLNGYEEPVEVGLDHRARDHP